MQRREKEQKEGNVVLFFLPSPFLSSASSSLIAIPLLCWSVSQTCAVLSSLFRWCVPHDTNNHPNTLPLVPSCSLFLSLQNLTTSFSDIWFDCSLFCDTPQWWMVDAMFIGFLLFLSIQVTAISAAAAAASVFSDCAFIQQTYLDSAAVRNQILFNNQTSITLTAGYAFDAPSTYELGLIYLFRSSHYFVPFPILFNCTTIVESCRMKTIAGSMLTSRESESIPVPLTPANYTTTTTSTSFRINQMGLYLAQGRYQLSNCTWNNASSITDPRQIFDIEIRFERTIGKVFNTNRKQTTALLLARDTSANKRVDNFACSGRVHERCVFFSSSFISLREWSEYVLVESIILLPGIRKTAERCSNHRCRKRQVKA